MVIGLISDTHGLLRPEAVDALRGSDLIVHAGDVGGGDILGPLEALAPVIAVKGNTDRSGPPSLLPATAVAQTGDGLVYVLHDIGELDFDPAAADFRAVVSGHSHQPAQSERDGILYVNPGSAGRRRFRLPVTVARLETGGGAWRVRFIDLLSPRAGG